jgi:CheY-like chemotaxis protein
MRILVVDEDNLDVPHICDEIRQSGHQVLQVADWKQLSAVVPDFKPDAILLDLMIPAIGLPSNECGGGFTTGAYIYEKMLHDLTPGVPFAVFSSAFLETSIIKQALKRLEQFPEYKGTISKGCNPEEIIQLIGKAK